MTSQQSIAHKLHEELHQVPGMPAHDEAARLNSNAHAARVHSTNHPAPAHENPSHTHANSRHDDPKILVSWQRFIGRLFGHAG